MENQKLLWIIFSVALFLVVVLAGALYFLRPAADVGTIASAAMAEPVSIGFDSVEYVRGTSEHLGVRDDTEAESGASAVQIVVGEADAGPTVAEPTDGAPAAVAIAADTIRVVPAAQAVKPSTSQSPAQTRPAASAPQQKPTPPPATPQVRTLYWIQTASYSQRSRAESMVETLSDQGITSRIQIKDVDGGTYFRVRVGPYAAKSEAQKFLSWIQGVDGLEGSYISQVYTQQG